MKKSKKTNNLNSKNKLFLVKNKKKQTPFLSFPRKNQNEVTKLGWTS